MFLRMIGCIAIMSLFFYSCQPASGPVKDMWDEVMVVHDEIMPKMSNMTKIKKKLKQLEQNPEIEAAIADLDKADKVMWDWMHNIKSFRKVKALEEEAALKYLAEEKTKIEEVKRMMLEGMKKGEDLLSAAGVN